MFYREFLLLFIVVAFPACQGSVVEKDNLPPLAQPSATTAIPTPSLATQQDLYASIRKVDFRNFTHTGPADYDSESFTLKNGQKPYVHDHEDGIFLNKVSYADLTGDGQEEAILRMTIQTGGTAIPSFIFIYALEDKKLKTLWKFTSGDRAEGGLKDVYSKDGALIIELFGDSKFLDGKWEHDWPAGKFKGLCCPTVYTKTRFKWDGEQFAVDGTREMFDITKTDRKN